MSKCTCKCSHCKAMGNIPQKKKEATSRHSKMKKTNTIATLLIAATLAGCGFTSRDNEVVGQVKRVVNKTPIVCPDYHVVDISMGVLREGVGNTSREDLWAVVPPAMVPQLKKLAESGSPVKVAYDTKRWVWCKDYANVVNSVAAIK